MISALGMMVAHSWPPPRPQWDALLAQQQEAGKRMREEWAAYQQAMRRARPIIAQWSEWEQQTRNPAWR